ncbi:MAG: hypothetical protein HC800_02110 [Phormidesmis sp. RL_2_1]|nr:hypothetical protein [Phormidesmis sp. RL_2_1]
MTKTKRFSAFPLADSPLADSPLAAQCWRYTFAGVMIAALGLLNACAVTLPSDQSDQSDQNVSGRVSADGSKPSAAETLACDSLEGQLEPLPIPQNAAIFEQFDFQPKSIEVANNTVIVQTPHYTFALCQNTGTWSIVSTESAAAETNEDFDYDQFLREIADPEYEEMTVNGDIYEYRIRLQAPWLTEQLNLSTAEAPSNLKEAVYFELKAPNGDITTRQLYTVEELRSAQLGASLGEPTIAGAVITGEALWWAATASQGEGDSGFASLLRYDLATQALTVQRPEDIQGEQITAIAATGTDENLTLWLGTKMAAEGNPALPASGLVAYQPSTQALKQHTVTHSPLVGAIPYQLTVADESLWVGTGNGICQVAWQAAEQDKSWNCWRFTATATLPAAGVDIYASALAKQPAAQLKAPQVEVLWVDQMRSNQINSEQTDSTAVDATSIGPERWRYEVAYAPGFELQLPEGGYRVTNEVAQRIAGDDLVFWPGREWHWAGDRFVRGLDEVALNLVGGGPHGIGDANNRVGFSFDHNAIRGAIELLALSAEGTKLRYYSAWIDGDDLQVYPEVVAASAPKTVSPNPLDTMAADLPAAPGP